MADAPPSLKNRVGIGAADVPVRPIYAHKDIALTGRYGHILAVTTVWPVCALCEAQLIACYGHILAINSVRTRFFVRLRLVIPSAKAFTSAAAASCVSTWSAWTLARRKSTGARHQSHRRTLDCKSSTPLKHPSLFSWLRLQHRHQLVHLLAQSLGFSAELAHLYRLVGGLHAGRGQLGTK